MEPLVTSLTAVAVRLAAAILPLGLSLTGAVACELCVKAANERLNLVDQLIHADRVVLARLDRPDGHLTIAASIKGDDRPGTLIAESVPLYGDPVRKPFFTAVMEARIDLASRSEPFLLVGGGIHPGWTNLGTIGEENSDWLRSLAAASSSLKVDAGWGGIPAEPGSEAVQGETWRGRVLQALPHLDGTVRSLERDLAWSEILGAPYGSLAVAKGRLTPEQVSAWLGDPSFATEVAGILHLYGYVGGTEGAKRVRERLLRAAEAHDTAVLTPLLAAHLELEGPSRVDWIVETYFGDRSRSMAEIQAALVALRLQGEANATIPRVRVVSALRRFIAERPAMAGSVAMTLSDWACWEAREDFEAIMASGAIPDPASEFAVALYLKRAAEASRSTGESQ